MQHAGQTGATLEALRAQIADIERRPAFKQDHHANKASEPNPFTTAPGRMHEIFTSKTSNGGASLGFALAQAKAFFTTERSALVYLQGLRGSQQSGLPYGPGLVSLGIDPARLVIVRPANIIELLWASEEALACRAVAAVIADIDGYPKALDFTASRRLSMRAGSAGTSFFILRYGEGREASAAQFRWGLEPAPSVPDPFDERAPGAVRWRVKLEKGALENRQTPDFLIGLNQNGQPINIDTSRTGRATPLPGAAPALLADRLSQTA